MVVVVVSCEKDPVLYTVSFDTNGGTGKPENQTHEAGEKVTKPSDPTKCGCDFVCWTKDGAAFDFDTDTVTGDMTLVAKWNYKTYEVGARGPAGGKIFYVADEIKTSTYTDASGKTETFTWKYLEVAPSDASNSSANKYVWGEKGELATGTIVGTGWSNMKIFEANTLSSFPAAKACADYGDGTAYDDWFLPSKEELEKLLAQKDVIGGLTGSYWSSSMSSETYSWFWSESGARMAEYYISGENCVRPIRAF